MLTSENKVISHSIKKAVRNGRPVIKKENRYRFSLPPIV
nr:MAG TPA: hypothetical protein [Caudoviricetes sp.]